jgi:2-polyprenyl-3-methyl-5-hydroxy-6-metoxy-1,4-benzoquinol methylase
MPLTYRVEDDFVKIDKADFRRYEEEHLANYSPHKYRREEFTYSGENAWVRLIFWSRLHRVFERVKACGPKRVLDAGCGEGALLLNLARISERCVGIDLNVKAAKRLMGDSEIQNVQLIEGDFTKTNFEPNSFDVVTATDVLEHVLHLSSFIQKIRRVLKPGGLLIVTIPNENLFYRIGRKVFGFSQNPDSCPHIWDAKQIIGELRREFRIVQKVPVRINFFENIWHKGEHRVTNRLISNFVSAFYLVEMVK